MSEPLLSLDLLAELSRLPGLPAFAVCTDEQLAAMARVEALTNAAMKQIEGIGDAKAQKYAAAFIAAHGYGGADPEGAKA